MKPEIVKSKYPHAYEQLQNYIVKMVKTQGVTDAVLAAFPIDQVITMTMMNIQGLRSLYDFFDDYQIHMFPMGSVDWLFKIVDPRSNHDNSENETRYPTRGQAEEAGFEMCFRLLEQKLSI